VLLKINLLLIYLHLWRFFLWCT